MKKVCNYLLELLFYFIIFTTVLYIGSLLKLTTFSFDKVLSFTIGYAIGTILFSFIKKKIK